MADMKTHTGGCHCAHVQFEVKADIVQVAECNCSICRKRGALWTFVPADQFTPHQGADTASSELSDYQFGKKNIHHLFCRHCGVAAFSRGKGQDGREMIAVNVRCLDDVDLASLKVTPFDGKSL
jgi:hypothetical protein